MTSINKAKQRLEENFEAGASSADIQNRYGLATRPTGAERSGAWVKRNLGAGGLSPVELKARYYVPGFKVSATDTLTDAPSARGQNRRDVEALSDTDLDRAVVMDVLTEADANLKRHALMVYPERRAQVEGRAFQTASAAEPEPTASTTGITGAGLEAFEAVLAANGPSRQALRKTPTATDGDGGKPTNRSGVTGAGLEAFEGVVDAYHPAFAPPRAAPAATRLGVDPTLGLGDYMDEPKASLRAGRGAPIPLPPDSPRRNQARPASMSSVANRLGIDPTLGLGTEVSDLRTGMRVAPPPRTEPPRPFIGTGLPDPWNVISNIPRTGNPAMDVVQAAIGTATTFGPVAVAGARGAGKAIPNLGAWGEIPGVAPAPFSPRARGRMAKAEAEPIFRTELRREFERAGYPFGGGAGYAKRVVAETVDLYGGSENDVAVDAFMWAQRSGLPLYKMTQKDAVTAYSLHLSDVRSAMGDVSPSEVLLRARITPPADGGVSYSTRQVGLARQWLRQAGVDPRTATPAQAVEIYRRSQLVVENARKVQERVQRTQKVASLLFE